jgi:transcriptional regulator with XRE-family HTH domain
MDLKDAMSTNLRRIRIESSRTQEEMADVLGISARYLGSIERGRASPSVTVLGNVAKALKIDPCLLIRDPRKMPR